MENLGKTLVIAGAVIVVAGLLIWLVPAGKWRWPGRLPGDILIRREGFRLYIPITSMLLLSALLSLALSLIRKWKA
jgi:hypothetical protein